MTRTLAATLALIAAPAFAWDTEPPNITTVDLIAPTGHVANVVTYNDMTMTEGTTRHTQEFPGGQIVIDVTVTPNIDCQPEGCPDLLEVISLPPGLIAVPIAVSVPEGSWATIKIFSVDDAQMM